MREPTPEKVIIREPTPEKEPHIIVVDRGNGGGGGGEEECDCHKACHCRGAATHMQPRMPMVQPCVMPRAGDRYMARRMANANKKVIHERGYINFSKMQDKLQILKQDGGRGGYSMPRNQDFYGTKYSCNT